MSQPSVLGWIGVVTGPVNGPPRGRTRQANSANSPWTVPSPWAVRLS